jgi:protein-tyrosine phosphatase
MSELSELVLRKWLKNVGLVNKQIVRSGQPENTLKFLALYKLFPFKSVINLAWNPATDDDDARELKFCIDHGIVYKRFSWGASVPLTPKYDAFWKKEFPETVALIDTLPKPLWIHCEGGRDRTGGLVAAWKVQHAWRLDEIFIDFCKYGMPDPTWLIHLWGK